MSKTTKLYVQENKIKRDGETLIQVLTYRSKPKIFDYIIFL